MNLKRSLKNTLVLPGDGRQVRRVNGRPGPNGGWEIEIEGAGSVELNPRATIEMAVAMLRSQGMEMVPNGALNA